MKRHQVDSIDTSADHSWPTTIRLRNREQRIRARRLLFESLEGRVLLSTTPIEDMRDQLRPYLDQGAVHGATIVTHGYQHQWFGSGDSLMDLALAIRNKADAGNAADEGAWLLDYDTSEGGTAVIDLGENGSILTGMPTEVVLLFDWAPESKEESAGWGEAAGDALFSTIVQLGLVDLSHGQNNSIPLHFIGHSFGCAVTSEAVERLARFSVPVDQVTYLDPHDFDQAIWGIDTAQRLYDLGLPQFSTAGQPADGLDYGVTVWDNVAFADVYYQTRGRNDGSFLPDSLVPEGRPILGAYNVWLRDGVELPDVDDWLGPYGVGDAAGDHGYVWNTFYLGTVYGRHPDDKPNPEDTVAWQTTGYAFSRLAHPEIASQDLKDFRHELKETVAPLNFFSARQDHEHTAPALTGLEAADQPAWAAAQFASDWAPSIVNGDFQLPQVVSELLPGWSDHGGGGDGNHAGNDGSDENRYLELNEDNASRTHNRVYVPADANWLQFQLKRDVSSTENKLQVCFDACEEPNVLAEIELDQTDTSFPSEPKLVPIPDRLRRNAHTFTFRIVSEDDSIDSQVWIDNVAFKALPTVKDTSPSLESGTLAAGTAWMQINFSDPVLGGGTADNYQLQGMGPDGLLGTADDVQFWLDAAHSGTQATLSFTNLPTDTYRLTVRDSITDAAGNALDGDANGLFGGDWVTEFVVVPPDTGVIVSGATYPTGHHVSPVSIAVADFNGDGIDDLVTANSGSDNVAVFTGDGAGGFRLSATYASGGSFPNR